MFTRLCEGSNRLQIGFAFRLVLLPCLRFVIGNIASKRPCPISINMPFYSIQRRSSSSNHEVRAPPAGDGRYYRLLGFLIFSVRCTSLLFVQGVAWEVSQGIAWEVCRESVVFAHQFLNGTGRLCISPRKGRRVAEVKMIVADRKGSLATVAG